MIRLSANLGFLWAGLPLPDAIRRAKAAGFDAVEFHWPYAEDRAAVKAALEETGLPLIGLNTVRGGDGMFGLSALPGREADARAAIDQAFDWAAALGARAVHVMAGRAEGPEAARAFAANLRHACDRAAETDATALIEPLNPTDAPGYFLRDLAHAAEVTAQVGRPELKIMFDVYHQQLTGGDLIRRFAAHRDVIGHVQIAAAPSRREPDEGEVAYYRLLPALAWDGWVGAEYRPRTTVEAGLGWMAAVRAACG
jgi:hydroxypyruvate isomerase